MIVCLCLGVSDTVVRAAIASGADTPGKVARACGAGADCGACGSTVRALIRASCGEPVARTEMSPYAGAGEAR